MTDDDRRVRVGDLVTLTEIAERAGVELNVVSNWTARYASFPAPIKDVPRARLWLWPDVHLWLRSTDRSDIGKAAG